MTTNAVLSVSLYSTEIKTLRTLLLYDLILLHTEQLVIKEDLHVTISKCKGISSYYVNATYISFPSREAKTHRFG